MVWNIQQLVLSPKKEADVKRLQDALGDGWEPYAAHYVEVTGHTIHFLRKSMP